MGGLIKCGHCGGHLINAHSAGRGNKKFFYYECSRSRQRLGCSYKRISATGFDDAIIKYFKRASEDQEIITKAIGNAVLDSQMKFEKIEKKMNEKQKELNSLKFEAEKLLELVMNKTILTGSTYKTKLAGIELRIGRLEDELSKLQAQKNVAQMNASSGEFLYSNIRVAMRCLDQAPPEAQKGLLQALIKDVIVYDDKIAINMYIENALQNILSSTIDPNSDENKKGLTPGSTRGKTYMAQSSCVSTGRPVWGE